ncbi:MAG: hypothetical protein NBV68_12420 [Erythrobacter sp.]|uniref:hypothetical protein n=1 Tax=Erythrobacter sp. TaxID=1042 RepID=UPI0025E527F4|nr:hypothetical protein [Erythrobacter sp.]MCM0000182.1 hypothetical protein [Erythrobacter sp.]
MHDLFAFAAPLALMLPLVAEAVDVAEPPAPAADPSAPQSDAPLATDDEMPREINPLLALRQSSSVSQVRIEQRVVIRIAPAPLAARQNLTADLPQRASPPRYEERGKEKCLGLGTIAGVQTGSGNRLVLYLRDRKMVSVGLEKACRARDFYSGFYVEKNKDGQLCVSRDKLQSRTGARCEIETMRQLVAVRS